MKPNVEVLFVDPDDDGTITIVLELKNIDMPEQISSARLVDRDGRKWKIVSVGHGGGPRAFEAGRWLLGIDRVDHDGVPEEGMKLLLECGPAD